MTLNTLCNIVGCGVSVCYFDLSIIIIRVFPKGRCSAILWPIKLNEKANVGKEKGREHYIKRY